jgi:ligand-binding sensor domain-containing protein
VVRHLQRLRFDGVAFAVFEPANTPQLPSAEIINVHGDRSGRLWVSTSRGMAVREGGRWRALGAADGWPSDYVRTFAERDNGDLLITTFHGEVLEFAGGRIVALPAPPGEAGKGYLGCVDDTSHWWVAQHRFVGSWDGQRWTSTVATTAKNAELVGCAPARGGGIWLLVEKLLRKYKSGVEVSRVTLPELPGGLWSMTEDSRGNVWFASYGEGVSRISPDGQMRRWTTTDGLVSASTRFVFEDREENLWIGTSGGGLTRFKPRRVQSFGGERGLTERVVSSLWPGRDGLWIATRGKGLFHLRDGAVTPVPLPIPNKVLIAQSVLTDRKGRVWFGTGQISGPGCCLPQGVSRSIEWRRHPGVVRGFARASADWRRERDVGRRGRATARVRRHRRAASEGRLRICGGQPRRHLAVDARWRVPFRQRPFRRTPGRQYPAAPQHQLLQG